MVIKIKVDYAVNNSHFLTMMMIRITKIYNGFTIKSVYKDKIITLCLQSFMVTRILTIPRNTTTKLQLKIATNSNVDKITPALRD